MCMGDMAEGRCMGEAGPMGLMPWTGTPMLYPKAPAEGQSWLQCQMLF